MRRWLLYPLAVILTALSFGARAEQGIGEWVHTAHATLRLISGQSTVPDKSYVFTVGLEFSLNAGWKIYWRSPGDAGYPPRVTWDGSQNIDTVAMAWPTPQRFSTDGIETIGYEDHVVLPLTVHIKEPAVPTQFSATVDFLICSNICVPAHSAVSLILEPGSAQATSGAPLLSQFVSQVPAAGRGITLQRAVLDAHQQLTAVFQADPPFQGTPDLFVEGATTGGYGLISNPPTTIVRDKGREAEITLSLNAAPTPITLTVTDGARGFEVTTIPQPVPAGPSLPLVIAIALLGGLILNLMPCVLPVLSLKVLALLSHSHASSRHHSRMIFLASSGGIIATFVILGGVLAVLKGAGMAVGWGIQFQQPIFLAIMVVILAVFSANLWGAFEGPLPAFISSAASRQGQPGETTLWGHAASGVFATLLATPCSAPFLGTAVGFALAHGPGEILSVFLSLGIGMATPYLALAAFPAVAAWLPRPGAWMLTLRKILAVSMGETALWLLAVLATESGLLPSGDRANVSEESIHWQRFDPALLKAASDKVIFVDVTADWCLTCKVNKATVLHSAAVATALSQPGVLALKADWTSPDATISAYLARFGRYGIPFNVIYGPHAPMGIVLPEVLTDSGVLAGLKAASAP